MASLRATPASRSASSQVLDEPDDALWPVELDGLERWAIQDRMLAERLAGVARNDAIAAELHRGQLPPGKLGQAVLQDIDAKVDALLVAAAAELMVEPESYDIDLDLGDDTRLTGTVAGVRGDVLLTLTPSSLSAKHRLAAWVNLLALTAAHPGREWRATTIGKNAWSSKLGPLDPDPALNLVRDVAAHVSPRVAGTVAIAGQDGRRVRRAAPRGDDPSDALIAADKQWADDRMKDGTPIPGEQSDAAAALIFGASPAITSLIAQPPLTVDEPHLFGALARRLWQPLLDAESQSRL